jgi:hypothetical protein
MSGWDDVSGAAACTTPFAPTALRRGFQKPCWTARPAKLAPSSRRKESIELNTPHAYYARNRRDDALGDAWDGIQAWREAVAEWQAALAAFEAVDTVQAVDAACYRLKAAEARIAALRQQNIEMPFIDTWDDEDRRLMALYDAVGRWLHWLLALLVPVAVVGWWWAWR